MSSVAGQWRSRPRGSMPLRGLWLSCLTPFALELAELTGVDWLGVDLQHGDLDVRDLPGLLRATAVPVLARVGSHDFAHLGRVLDLGVDGLIVPMVESGEQAAALVEACHAPPRGRRSFGLSRSSGMPPGGPPVLLAMIETAAGLREVESIAATPGVDGLFVGPYDLALSVGAPALDSAENLAATTRIVDTATAHGLLSGVFVGRPELLGRFPAVDFLGVASDVGCLSAGIRAAFAAPTSTATIPRSRSGELGTMPDPRS